MGEIYKEYQVTDSDIRFKVCVTAMKWCDEQLQHLAKKREAIKNIPDKINGQTVSSKDELLKLQQYRQSLLEDVDKEELQIEGLRIPADVGYNTPLDTFREHLKEPLLTGVSMLLMASQGSEALIHSSEYERAASELTQKIWAGEFIKQHSENAYFGLHGSDTEKIKAYTILLKTNEWLRDAQLKPYQPKQTAAPAGVQATKKDTPIIEAVKSWEPGKTRPKIFYTEIDKIKKRLGVGTDQAVNSFCSEHGFSGQEKAFEKSYECHCKKLVKKRKDRATINPR